MTKKTEKSTFDKLFDTSKQNDEFEQHEAFLTQRGSSHSASTLTFKLPDQATVLPYSYLRRTDFKPKEGIVLHYAGTTVKIQGKTLLPLFEAISRQIAFFVEQNNSKYQTEEKDKIWIDKIEITDSL